MGNSESRFTENIGSDLTDSVTFFAFKNMSNTCYCNSVLQALLSSRHVKCYLDSAIEEIAKHPEWHDWSPLIQLLAIHAKRKQSKTRVIQVRPTAFLEAVARETKQFQLGYQHDVHEFLLYLIESFDKTLERMRRVGSDVMILAPFSKLFEGTRVSTYECSVCEQFQQVMEEFTTMDIPIVPEGDLQEMIDDSLAPESMDSDWKCDHCKEKRVGRALTHFSKLPPVLMVQLQRFKCVRQTNQMLKLSQFVEIPEELYMNSETGPQKYHLASIIVHLGSSLRYGHFIALIKVEKRWMLANDDQLAWIPSDDVNQVLAGRVTDKKAAYVPYLLMYEC